MVCIKTDGIRGLQQEIKNKRLVCFGAGDHFRTILHLYNSYSLDQYIDYILDNNPSLFGTYKFLGGKQYRIESPERFFAEVNANEVVLLITNHLNAMEIVSQLDQERRIDGLSVYVGSFLSEISEYESKFSIENTGHYKIPKVIHFCWFGGGEIPKDYANYMKSWRKFCPDYEIKRWDETNFDVSANTYMYQAYKHKKWAFVSDYARLKIVYEYGGIYLDCDVELLKSLDDFLAEDLFCGFEDYNHINLGLGYGAVAKHPYLKRLMDYYDTLDFVDSNGDLNLTPCPAYQTEVLKEFGIRDDNMFQRHQNITVFPSEVFSPISNWGMGEITEKAYSIHHFGASWQSPQNIEKINTMSREYHKRISSAADKDRKREKDLVSIIVPIYNAADYLKECIESIVGQDYKAIEIILVDDGSTDGCFGICENYKNEDGRIKVLHKKNEGLVRARKDGLKLARGKYIYYVDADDWIEKDTLRRLVELIEQQNTDIVMCGHYEDTGITRKAIYHGFKEGRYDKNQLCGVVYPRMLVNEKFFEWGIWPGLCNKLFQRELLESFQFAVDDRLTMGEDIACLFPCMLKADSIYILHKCLYHYRQTPSSMVKIVEDKHIERERFRILYESVSNSFYKFSGIYDLREQWIDYMLFLMTPRSDTLYKGIEKLDFLFPFPKVKKGSKIILYGMGTYGQRLYRYLRKTNFCNIVAVADQNYIELQKQGLNVIAPEMIGNYQFDAIVVAGSFFYVRHAIYQDLIGKFPFQKVHLIDERLIKSKKTIDAFGLGNKNDSIDNLDAIV